jgi:hypothetical protein
VAEVEVDEQFFAGVTVISEGYSGGVTSSSLKVLH